MTTAPVRILVLPGEATAAKTARDFVTDNCARYHSADVLHDARLLVTELVANAIRHGGRPIEVELWCVHGTGLKVAVHDPGPGMPDLRAAGPDSEEGRGLAIVSALSDEWGIRAGSPGKAVWFLLSR